jgi:hypothetical protein
MTNWCSISSRLLQGQLRRVHPEFPSLVLKFFQFFDRTCHTNAISQTPALMTEKENKTPKS